MAYETQDDRTSTILAAVAGLALIVFAGWVVWGSGLFAGAGKAELEQGSAAPAAAGRPAAQLTQAPADEALGLSADRPGAGTAAGAAAEPKDRLMAEIVAKLKPETAVRNEALLTFRNKAALDRFLKQARAYGLEVVGALDALNAVRVRFASPESLRDYLAASGAERPSLEANHWMSVPSLAKPDPTNQGGAQPSGADFLKEINATGDRTQWGKGVTVAVLDTGVKTNPTFGDGQVSHVDLVNDGTAFHSHGTSVASLIAGQDERVPGVSPDANVMDIRVADSKGYSVTSVLAQGIMVAADRGAGVINISLGGYDDSDVLRQAIAYAMNKGVVVVAAAGNEKYDELAFPARIPGVISVGAVDGSGVQAYFSNSGQGLVFVAPGVSLPVAWDTYKMALASGTSQAAAVVSGEVAYYLGQGMNSQQAIAAMKANAQKLQGTPLQVGFGKPLVK